MRVRAAVVLSIVSIASGAGAVACFDLFHSTHDILTACEIDARAPGCAPIDLCADSHAEARQRAEHACAWLGACETPLGLNAFGSCMFQALMAYDCAANPNHGLRGKAAGLWGCLAGVKSCGDVGGCVFPQGEVLCGGHGGYTACGTPATLSSATAENVDVRIECEDGGTAHGENCALWGQTCLAGPSGGAACSAIDAGVCAQGSVCDDNDTAIRCGADGGSLVIDCASFGTQHCSGFPVVHAPSWVACVAESDAGDAATCFPDASAACVDGVSVSCPSGVLETLDCNALLGSMDACSPGPLVPPFEWTGACGVAPAECDADSCDASVLTGCGRGAAFSVDCEEAGLGACSLVTTDEGSLVRAACAPHPH